MPGGASSFIHLATILATMPIRTTGCAISPLVSASRYIETAANCPRNRCFLSLFPRPSKREFRVYPSRLILSPTISPSRLQGRTKISFVGELSVTNYVSCRLHSTGSSDSLRCRPFLPISLPRKNYSLRRFVGDPLACRRRKQTALDIAARFIKIEPEQPSLRVIGCFRW